MKKLVMTLALIGMSSSSAFANSLKTECRLVGAHMTPTVMLSMEANEYGTTQVIERDLEAQNVLETKSSQIQVENGWVRKGETALLASKASKATYKIVALEDSKDLGTWQDKPVDDQCAPYGDMSTSTVPLEITMTKASKVVAKKTVLMVCESRGGYHGYYGQKGCEIDEK